MENEFSFKPKGVCSQMINFEVDNGIVKNVTFQSGCNGNLKAIGALVEGMQIDEVIKRIQGISCGSRGTSCSDQFAQALISWKKSNL